jgi:protein TonB
MTKPGDSFVAEDFLRATKGDVALWTTASLLVIAGLVGGYWAYQTFMPVEEVAGPPAAAMVVEFAEFAVSPVTEELDVPEGEASAASDATPPSEAEPDPEAEPIEEPEPVEPPPEVEPEEVTEPEEVVAPEEVVETAEAEVEPPPEPEVEPAPLPEPAPEPEPAVVPEPVEPIIEVPEVEVPEPAVVIQRQMATVERPEPEPEPEPVVEPEEIVEPPLPEPEPVTEPVPEEPVVEPVDPNLPVPVTMSPRIAETRANTPETKFTPPPRRAPPPQQAASQAAAPKPAAQQAEQAAAPQQTASAPPSDSQVSSWQSSVQRHIGRRLRYPADARRRGEEGRVMVQFSIDRGGNVRSVRITGSSGYASLDQAAIDLVYASSPVPRPPEGLPEWGLNIGIPLDYDQHR